MQLRNAGLEYFDRFQEALFVNIFGLPSGDRNRVRRGRRATFMYPQWANHVQIECVARAMRCRIRVFGMWPDVYSLAVRLAEPLTLEQLDLLCSTVDDGQLRRRRSHYVNDDPNNYDRTISLINWTDTHFGVVLPHVRGRPRQRVSASGNIPPANVSYGEALQVTQRLAGREAILVRERRERADRERQMRGRSAAGVRQSATDRMTTATIKTRKLLVDSPDADDFLIVSNGVQLVTNVLVDGSLSASVPVMTLQAGTIQCFGSNGDAWFLSRAADGTVSLGQNVAGSRRALASLACSVDDGASGLGTLSVRSLQNVDQAGRYPFRTRIDTDKSLVTQCSTDGTAWTTIRRDAASIATFAQSILPASGNLNVGTGSNRWLGLYASNVDADTIACGAATFSCNLSVSGDASVGGSLQASSAVVGGSLAVTGPVALSNALTGTSATFSSNVTIAGSFSYSNLALSGSLSVAGLTTISNTLRATSATFSSNVTVSGTSTLSSDANIRGALAVTGPLTLSSALWGNSASFSGNLSVSGATTLSSNTTVGGSLAVTGPVTLSSTLGGTSATLSSNLTVSGSTTVSGALGGTTAAFSSNLSVSGVTTLSGALGGSSATFSSNLTVSGTFTLSSNATVGGSLYVSGPVTLSSTLGATSATFSSNMSVAEITSGTLSASGPVTLYNTLGATSATFSNNVSIGGTLSVASNLAVTGPATFASNITISNTDPINSHKTWASWTPSSDSNATLTTFFARYTSINKRVTVAYSLSFTVASSVASTSISLPPGHSVAYSAQRTQIFSKNGGSNIYVTSYGSITVPTAGTATGLVTADSTTSRLVFALTNFLAGTWTASGTLDYEIA
ncbi:hypothetical protein KFL_010130055 [Klebsormidium nitens]|uniref:Uncharacterized protein n=1 Tax=Klebsormidium nitens TaxID=105231 RepID=A0A1Y1ISD7_KLENI|nr:hypothetical protein KFL_010130055 [Klebsormidium nitens]|eukprot:GAQ92439.1 hypothetical protein KFL_010130055 [Klebsormidium nitens]